MLTSLKTELKQNFSDLKNGIQKEKWFLIALSVLTILFLLSMFFEPVVYLVIVCILLLSVFFDFEKTLSLFLFICPFMGIFSVNIGEKALNLFNYTYYIMFFICGIKYLLCVFKKKEEFNLKAFRPLVFFLFYIILPIFSFHFESLVKYAVAVAIIYLLIVNTKNFNFKTLLAYAVLGVILSSFLSLFSSLTTRMPEILGQYSNYNVLKFQGLFTNPNSYAVFVSILLPLVVYFCLQKNGILWFAPLIVISSFAYMTLSRNYLICLFVVILYYFISLCFRKNKRMMISFIFVLITFLMVSVCELNNTRVYLARFELIPIEKIEPTLNPEDVVVKPDEKPEYWEDGTALDPGRVGIWKRYIKDFLSSPENIIFGRGISADVLGLPAHNTFIQFLWQFGLLGCIISIYSFFEIFSRIFKNLKSDQTSSLLVVLIFIFCVESILFEKLFISAIILLLTGQQSATKKDENTCNFDLRKKE